MGAAGGFPADCGGRPRPIAFGGGRPHLRVPPKPAEPKSTPQTPRPPRTVLEAQSVCDGVTVPPGDRERGHPRPEELDDAQSLEVTVWTGAAGLAQSSSTWMDPAVLMEYKARAGGEHVRLSESSPLQEPLHSPLLLTRPLHSDTPWPLRAPSP
ncbi:hypothetical protein Q5P01_015480 [Channa striata]|uniref:Uncharacterized protein n=1 Tax=Channa striata TaxID=64152 RepID=A0AA88MEB6_CHASR|nr:hypothetical protein Q5P01_015480 [Channa striata]